jgi:hypothetical protein
MRNGTGRGGIERSAPDPARRSRRALAPAALALLALAGCAGSSITAPAVWLPGSWTWVRAEGGIAAMVRTPESEGYEQRLVFTSAGDAILFRDDEEVGRSTYTLGVGAPGSSHDGRTVVRYGLPLLGFEEQAVHFPSSDQLVLDDGCCDGFRWTFERGDEG